MAEDGTATKRAMTGREMTGQDMTGQAAAGQGKPDAAGGTLLHGGDLDGARAAFPGAPAPWIDLSTGINPWPYPLPPVPLDAWTRLPGRGRRRRCARRRHPATVRRRRSWSPPPPARRR
ncbi:hypothetical protein [Azospirillum thiophilum]|uniref:hypothetical protein n=1 Tax=Azospirillum thiophilum TaxID=528244 RepID=UPI000B006FEF|nr:hypothetical protein [Azospirillum thiophilum]